MKRIAWIALLAPILTFGQESSFSKRVELGLVATGGNTESSTVSGKVDLEKKWANSSLWLGGSALSSRQDGKEVAGKTTAGLKGRRRLSGRLFASLTGDYERNRFAGFDYRIQAGPGLGLEIAKGERHALSATASGVLFWERSVAPSAEAETFFSLKAGAEDLWKLTPQFTLKNKVDFFVPLKESDRYLVNWTASVESALSKVLSLGMGYTLNYQNRPPVAGLKKTDTLLTGSLIVQF